MKVLHVVPSLEVGGVQRFVTDLLPQLANYCQVTLLVFADFFLFQLYYKSFQYLLSIYSIH